MKNTDLFAKFSATLANTLFEETHYPWEVLPKIKEYILSIGPLLCSDEYDYPADNVWIHKSAKVFPNHFVAGPCIIGANTEVRPNAFIRGSVLVGADCVIGNATEIKNSILFDYAKAPHYNYVGDSIIGYCGHLGAGVICSNIKSDKTLVVVHDGSVHISTGLRKLGAILGDYVEIGCNSVLCPGSVLYPYASVYPVSRVRGVVKANQIYKAQDDVIERIQM